MSTVNIATRVWSPEQQAIFSFIENEDGSLMVVAGAGAGKTTTGVEAFKRVSIMESALFLAFNKRIQETLEARLGKGKALTFHSLGNRAWKRHSGEWPKLEGFKVSALVREHTRNSDPEFKSDVGKLVGFAKGIGLVPSSAELTHLHGLAPDIEEVWMDLIDEHNLDFGKATPASAIQLARRVLIESILQAPQVIDFNDQLYMPIISDAQFNQYDVLFVDEAQDVNEIQREIIRRSLAPGGRLIAIGDPNQAIYAFRGAGNDSMQLLQQEFHAKELPLSVSYRCPLKVIEDANEQVEWLRAREGAPEGKVEHVYSVDPKEIRDSDVVLCRLNAPLVEYAFGLIAAGRGCKVLGRDIGTGLISLVKKMHAENISDLEKRLAQHLESERTRLIKEGKAYKLNSLQDRIDTIYIFTRQMQGSSITTLLERINSLFDDEINPHKITLSTIHKAKGLEWPRVYLLKYGLIGQWSQLGVPDQEDNLRYVAKTRAQEELIYIEE